MDKWENPQSSREKIDTMVYPPRKPVSLGQSAASHNVAPNTGKKKTPLGNAMAQKAYTKPPKGTDNRLKQGTAAVAGGVGVGPAVQGAGSGRMVSKPMHPTGTHGINPDGQLMAQIAREEAIARERQRMTAGPKTGGMSDQSDVRPGGMTQGAVSPPQLGATTPLFRDRKLIKDIYTDDMKDAERGRQTAGPPSAPGAPMSPPMGPQPPAGEISRLDGPIGQAPPPMPEPSDPRAEEMARFRGIMTGDIKADPETEDDMARIQAEEAQKAALQGRYDNTRQAGQGLDPYARGLNQQRTAGWKGRVQDAWGRLATGEADPTFRGFNSTGSGRPMPRPASPFDTPRDPSTGGAYQNPAEGSLIESGIAGGHALQARPMSVNEALNNKNWRAMAKEKTLNRLAGKNNITMDEQYGTRDDGSPIFGIDKLEDMRQEAMDAQRAKREAYLADPSLEAARQKRYADMRAPRVANSMQDAADRRARMAGPTMEQQMLLGMNPQQRGQYMQQKQQNYLQQQMMQQQGLNSEAERDYMRSQAEEKRAITGAINNQQFTPEGMQAPGATNSDPASIDVHGNPVGDLGWDTYEPGEITIPEGGGSEAISSLAGTRDYKQGQAYAGVPQGSDFETTAEGLLGRLKDGSTSDDQWHATRAYLLAHPPMQTGTWERNNWSPTEKQQAFKIRAMQRAARENDLERARMIAVMPWFPNGSSQKLLEEYINSPATKKAKKKAGGNAGRSTGGAFGGA